MGHDLLRRSHFQVLLGVVAATTALAVRPLWPAPATERAAWLADLDRLEAHTAAAYANLGDRLASRKLAPRDLDRQARAALARARTVGEARAALEAFVGAFDDLHFRARAPYGAPRRWLRRLLGKDRRREAGGIAWTESAKSACARFGVRDRRHGNVDWSSLAGFRALADEPVARPFPAGILRQGGQPTVGLVRVGLFGQEGYPELCAAEWDRFRRTPTTTAACDEECQTVFWSGLEETLLDRFAAELGELAAGGAAVLLVDLTDNGGGTGIVRRMARMVTARPLPERAFGFIRHPHSVQRFESAAADYTEKLGRADLPERQRELLQAALARIQAAAREAKAPCDLSKMWSLASAAELPCSNVGRSEPWLDSDERAELAALRAAESGGSSSRAVRGTAWNGTLLVLTNRRTASASEDFAASLQDAGARIVGERTAGVGCGYTGGGLTLELPATGLIVRAPDCIRYRADGGNEAEGVIPDITVDWSSDDDARARAAKVIAALQAPRI